VAGEGDPRDHLTRRFVDRFDAIVVMHESAWIVNNWEVIRHKPVIWRTIGQSLPERELMMQSYRNDGLIVVRYSPNERLLRHFAGEDALIRFYKDSSHWNGWTGERPAIVCIAQSMPGRSVHCNFDTFLKATEGLPSELYGPGNEAAGAVWKGCLSYEALRSVMRTSRVCFHTGTFPASYTLGFIEAWMTGIPIVAIGSNLFGRVCPGLAGLYEVPELIQHEVNGFVSDSIEELHSCLNCVLTHFDYARQISAAGRAAAQAIFDKPMAREGWHDIFRRLRLM
jgi:hypothetical protein